MTRTVAAILCVAAAACSAPQVETTAPAATLARVDVEAEGANCEHGGQAIRTGRDSNGNGALEDDEVTATTYVCREVETPPRRDVLLRTSGASREECPHDGYLVSSGLDTNGNETLDDDEVTSSLNVCFDAPAPEGTLLIAIDGDVPVEQCAPGGLRIRSGIDTNLSGFLDELEVKKITYVCHGEGGLQGLDSLVLQTPESPGTNCAKGGTRIQSGVDDDRSGTLEGTEVDQTTYVCAGECPSKWLDDGAGGCTHAVTFELTGQVLAVEDDQSLLAGRFSAGQSFTASLTFDTLSEDYDADVLAGRYRCDSSVCAFAIEVDGETFTAWQSPGAGNFLFDQGIMNDWEGSLDWWTVNATDAFTTSVANLTVGTMMLTVSSNQLDRLTSTEQFLSPLDLSLFSSRQLQVGGNGWLIRLEPTGMTRVAP